MAANSYPNKQGGSPSSRDGFDLIQFTNDVISQLGVEDIYTHPNHHFRASGDKWRGGCCHHESQSGSSFVVNQSSLLFYCAGCQFGGSPIDYLHSVKVGHWKKPRGRDYVETVRTLCEIAGIAFPDYEMSAEKVEKAQKWETRKTTLQAVSEYSQEVLWSDRGETARQYLIEERRLTEEGIRDLDLGLYLSHKEVEQVLSEKGYNLQDAREAGVLWGDLEGYILFPWLDSRGRPLTIYGRWSVKVPPQGKPKTIALPGQGTKSAPLYLDRALKSGHKKIVLVEGVFDAAILQSAGDTRVCAYVGASCSELQIETLKRERVESVTLCGDPDTGGERGTLSNLQRISKAGIEVYVAPRLPDGLDPDEFLISKGIEGWKQHIAGAIHGYTYYAHSIVNSMRIAETLTDQEKQNILQRAIEFSKTVTDTEGKLALEVFFWSPLAKVLGVNLEDLKQQLKYLYQQNNADNTEKINTSIPGNSEETSKVKSNQVSNNIINFSEGGSIPDLFNKTMVTVGEILKIKDEARQVWELGILAKSTRIFSAAQLVSIFKLKQQESEPFNPTEVHIFIAQGPDERQWLIAGHLSLGTTSLLFSDGGVGKTLFAYDLCKAIATGQPWNGFRIRQGKVLILQADEPEVDTRERLNIANFGQEVPQGVVHIETNWQFSQIRKLKEWIQQERPIFVMIDSFTSANRVSEQQEKDANYASCLYELRDIANQFGCSIMVLHHENKGGGARGTTAIRNNVSEVWHLRRGTPKDQLTATQRILEIEKSRSGCCGTYKIELNVEDYSWLHLGEFGNEQNSAELSISARLLKYLESNRGVRFEPQELTYEFAGTTRDSIRKNLERLRSRGLLEAEERVKNREGTGTVRYKVYYAPILDVQVIPDKAEIHIQTTLDNPDNQPGQPGQETQLKQPEPSEKTLNPDKDSPVQLISRLNDQVVPAKPIKGLTSSDLNLDTCEADISCFAPETLRNITESLNRCKSREDLQVLYEIWDRPSVNAACGLLAPEDRTQVEEWVEGNNTRSTV